MPSISEIDTAAKNKSNKGAFNLAVLRVFLAGYLLLMFDYEETLRLIELPLETRHFYGKAHLSFQLHSRHIQMCCTGLLLQSSACDARCEITTKSTASNLKQYVLTWYTASFWPHSSPISPSRFVFMAAILFSL